MRTKGDFRVVLSVDLLMQSVSVEVGMEDIELVDEYWGRPKLGRSMRDSNSEDSQLKNLLTNDAGDVSNFSRGFSDVRTEDEIGRSRGWWTISVWRRDRPRA